MSEEQLEQECAKLRHENQRLRGAIRIVLDYWTEPDTGRCRGCGATPPEAPRLRSCKVCTLRDTLGEQYGPRPACPKCGMGGDVGGTEPNPIPF